MHIALCISHQSFTPKSSYAESFLSNFRGKKHNAKSHSTSCYTESMLRMTLSYYHPNIRSIAVKVSYRCFCVFEDQLILTVVPKVNLF